MTNEAPAMLSEPSHSGPAMLRMEYDYSGKLSFVGHLVNRLLLFVKGLMALPLYIAVMFYAIAASVAIFFAFWSILIVGQFPRPLFRFVRGFMRFQYRVMAYYPLYMTNHWLPTSSHPLKVEIEYPQRCSRLVLLFLKLPALMLGIVTGVAGFGVMFLMFMTVVAWLAILITGKYPRWAFRMSRGLMEWHYRLFVWQNLMRDDASMFGATAMVRSLTFAGMLFSMVLMVGVPVVAALMAMGTIDMTGVTVDGRDLGALDAANFNTDSIESIGSFQDVDSLEEIKDRVFDTLGL